MLSLNEINTFFDEQWYDKRGIIVSLLIASVFLVTLLVPTTLSFLNISLILVLIDIALVIAWFVSKLPPKAQRNKVGFLVAIRCSDKNELLKLEQDFINPLRKLISSGSTGNTFSFIALPQHLCKGLNSPDDAVKMRIKCRAHFMISGQVKIRKIGLEEFHMVELIGLVAHNPIAVEHSEQFAEEFTELLPTNVRIAVENDVLNFQFTSAWANVVSKYIISQAAAFSGDIDYSESLLKDAQSSLAALPNNFPIFEKLNGRIPSRLAQLYEYRAVTCHRLWVGNYEATQLDQMKMWLDKIPPSCQSSSITKSLEAIYAFWADRDVAKAIGLIESAISKVQPESTKLMSLAFLYGYKGDLKKAIRYYRQAAQGYVQDDVIYQVEDFINKVLEQEPQKFTLYYCLGFFNKEIKGDNIIASQNLHHFLLLCPPTKYPKERALAMEWLNGIDLEASNKKASALQV